MKTPKVIRDLLNNKQHTKPISIYFAYKTIQEGYDPYEDKPEYDSNNLNPITIHAKVSDLTAEKIFYKQYGKTKNGAVEIITYSKYKNYFLQANKIVIDNDDYAVWKDAGGQVGITDRPFNTIRVVLERK